MIMKNIIRLMILVVTGLTGVTGFAAATTNRPGLIGVAGSSNTTNPPGSILPGSPTINSTYPIVGTNGALIWPTNFWSANSNSLVAQVSNLVNAVDAGVPGTNKVLWGTTSFGGTTSNALAFVTNNYWASDSTNYFVVTGAGTTAANGTYTKKTPTPATLAGVWTNTTACGLVADPNLNEGDFEWTITNAAGSLYVSSESGTAALVSNPSNTVGTTVGGWSADAGSGTPVVAFGRQTNNFAEFTLRGMKVRAPFWSGHGGGLTNLYATNVVGTFNSNSIDLALDHAYRVDAALSGASDTMTNLPVPGAAIARACLVPPLAYNPWWDYGIAATEANIRTQALRMIVNGMQGAGYNWISMDDGWEQATRDVNGNLQVNATKFPGGVSNLVYDLHVLGYKVGLYTAFSALTCGNFAGTPAAYVYKDMAQWASWGVDLVKIDACAGQPTDLEFQAMFRLFGDANLRVTGVTNRPPMVLLYTHHTAGAFHLPWQNRFEMNIAEDGNPDQFHADTNFSLGDLLTGLYRGSTWSNHIAPGHFIEAVAFDALDWSAAAVKNGMTLFALESSPIFISSVTNTTKLSYVTNATVLKVQQDEGCIMANRVYNTAGAEVWVKPLRARWSGSNAVALVNGSGGSLAMTIYFTNLTMAPNAICTVKDAWSQTVLGNYSNSFSATIADQDAGLYVISAGTLGEGNGAGITNLPTAAWSGTSGNTALAAATTYYFQPQNSSATLPTTDVSAGTRQMVTRTTVLTNLYVIQSAAAGSGKSYTYTVMTNGVASSMVATVTGAVATTANDLTHAVTIVPGVEVGVKVVTDSGATGAKVGWGFEGK